MNNDITPSSSKDEKNLDGPETSVEADSPVAEPAESTVTQSKDTSDTQPVSSGNAGSVGKKGGWSRRIVFAIVVLALLGGAVWAAVRLNTPEKPAVSTVKKEVPVLRLGVQEPLASTFWPAIPNNTGDSDIDGQVFEGLTTFQDKTRVVPALATSWSNPDNSTWVFKLREGVKFHTGRPLTAQAVKDAFDGMRSNALWDQFGDTFKDVSVVDEHTVKITTIGPDPLLASKLCFLWIYDTKGKPNDSANGTGPYVEKPGTTISEKGVKLVAYDDYYGGRPKVRELDYVHYDDDQAVFTALQKHQIDMGFIDDQSLIKKAGSSYKEYVQDGLSVAFIVPNTTKTSSPIANKTVRKAIETALDPAALLSARGLSGAPASQLVPELVPGFNPDIKRPKTDAAKAKQLLAEAGYPNGTSFTLTYYYTAHKLGVEVQKELAPAGITVKLDEISDGDALQQKALGGGTEAFYFTSATDLIDLSDAVQGTLTTGKNYHSDKVDQLQQQAATELNPTKRLQILKQISSALMDDMAVIPLYELNGFTWAAPANLHLTQDRYTGVTGVEFWKAYQE